MRNLIILLLLLFNTAQAQIIGVVASSRSKAVAGQNLLKYSEDFSSVWQTGSLTVTANSGTAPDGENTVSELTTSNAFHSIKQFVSVVPGNTYVFSFYAKTGTMATLKYSIYNNTSPGEIVAPTSYHSLLNSSTMTRVSFTFVAPVGCSSVAVYLLRDSGGTGTSYMWGAQVNEGSLKQYTKTGSSIIP